MDMEQFEKLNAEAGRRLSVSANAFDAVRANGFVVIELAAAKLLQIQVKSGAYCNPTKEELDKIDSEIAKTQSAMRMER